MDGRFHYLDDFCRAKNGDSSVKLIFFQEKVSFAQKQMWCNQLNCQNLVNKRGFSIWDPNIIRVIRAICHYE